MCIHIGPIMLATGILDNPISVSLYRPSWSRLQRQNSPTIHSRGTQSSSAQTYRQTLSRSPNGHGCGHLSNVSCCGVGRRLPTRPAVIALDLSIVDVERSTVIPHRVVELRGGKIHAIRAVAEYASDAQGTVVNCRGLFLCPGLIDCTSSLPRN